MINIWPFKVSSLVCFSFLFFPQHSYFYFKKRVGCTSAFWYSKHFSSTFSKESICPPSFCHLCNKKQCLFQFPTFDMGIFVEIKCNKYYILHLIALFNLVCTGYNEGGNNASYIKPNNVGCGKYDPFMLLLFSGGLVMAAQLK